MEEEINQYPASINERETIRLEIFSDGIFAIAITLLIIDVRAPGHSENLLHDTLSEWPAFLGYVISFLTILVIWMNHHALFKQIYRVDRLFILINGLLLMVVTFINYPTSLVALYLNTSQHQTAMVIYSGTYVLIALLFQFLLYYASHKNRLLAPNVDFKIVKDFSKAYKFGPILYFIALLAAFINVYLCLFLNAVLVVYFAAFGRK